jgi:hypothetical protein
MAIHQQEQWMQQWRRAAVALAEVRRRALAQMSEADALVAANRVLAAGGPSTIRRPPTRSGLVEQQRLFHRRRS